MDTGRPTIDDVARTAKVSKATVSAVVNGKGSIGERTRERVLRVIEELNYRPKGVRGNARRQTGQCIGVIIREQENPFYTEIIAGVRSVVADLGYTVAVVSSEGDHEAERRAVEALREHDIAGLLLYPVLTSASDLAHLFELKRRNFPFVLLEAVWGVQASLVEMDNEIAAQKAAEYLLSLGHTRVVYFAGPKYSMNSKHRINGTFRAFSGSRIAFSEESVISVGSHIADGHREGLRLFQQRDDGDRPTAVACYNDMVAIGLCRALEELGLDVPGDVSVVGFDDSAFLDYLRVPLTTVRVPKFQIGEAAARTLLEQIDAKEAPPPRRVKFETDMVVRRSARALHQDANGAEAPTSAVPRRRRA
jgi:DNA-binding LacI/PurR family transcriptional regulator